MIGLVINKTSTSQVFTFPLYTKYYNTKVINVKSAAAAMLLIRHTDFY